MIVLKTFGTLFVHYLCLADFNNIITTTTTSSLCSALHFGG